MAAKFSDSTPYLYQPGTVFFGEDDYRRDIGIDPETHLLTVAASGSGKGAGLIVPNARKWAHNLLVIDPKGENARLSWEARETLGQEVAVIDPFKYADIPERLRKSFNPLDAIEAADPNARENLEVIADGLIVRSDPKHAQWDNGAADLLAGIMAYVCDSAPPHLRTLSSVRAFLLQPNESIQADAAEMAEISAFGGLCKAAALTLVTGFNDKDSMEKDFLEAARRQTSWLDSDPIKSVLASSSFELSHLKKGQLSLFLVLPPKYLTKRAGLLRLFVRSAIDAMMEQESGRRCLFILDEFAALGRIEEVAKNAPVMRSYGLHLWPFLQNLGQLPDLYGEKGAESFMANADAHLFFGNDLDDAALLHVSKRLGVLQANEVAASPPKSEPFKTPWWYSKGDPDITDIENRHRSAEENKLRVFQHDMQKAGGPRVTPEEVAAMTGKGPGEKVARSMIVFLKGGDRLKLRLAPYFAQPQQPAPAPTNAATTSGPVASSAAFPSHILKPFMIAFGVCFAGMVLRHQYANASFSFLLSPALPIAAIVWAMKKTFVWRWPIWFAAAFAFVGFFVFLTGFNIVRITLGLPKQYENLGSVIGTAAFIAVLFYIAAYRPDVQKRLSR